jgi:hypothetical protein
MSVGGYRMKACAGVEARSVDSPSDSFSSWSSTRLPVGLAGWVLGIGVLTLGCAPDEQTSKPDESALSCKSVIADKVVPQPTRSGRIPL